MTKCFPYDGKFKYRLFEHYFGKFDETLALCDLVDKQTGNRLIKVLEEYYKDRPMHFFLKEIEYDVIKK